MKRILIISSLLIALAACRSSQPASQHFYLIEYDREWSAPWPEGLGTMAGTCEIASVWVAPAYASHQIAMRTASHQLRYFTFNEWAVRPEQAMTQLSLDFFEAFPVFEQIVHGRLVTPANYRLETEVHHLELDTRQQGVGARVHFVFSLYDMEDEKQLIHRHVADRTQELEKKNLNEFATAISRLFQEELQAFSIQSLQK